VTHHDEAPEPHDWSSPEALRLAYIRQGELLKVLHSDNEAHTRASDGRQRFSLGEAITFCVGCLLLGLMAGIQLYGGRMSTVEEQLRAQHDAQIENKAEIRAARAVADATLQTVNGLDVYVHTVFPDDQGERTSRTKRGR
jgi:hypothetical protein